MRISSLDILACPECLGGLEVQGAGEGDVETGYLKCKGNNHRFPIRSGIPKLVRSWRISDADEWAARYSRVWQEDGWGAPNPCFLLALPGRDLSRRQSGKWRVKARSMEALSSFLEGEAPGRVLDLGSGVCWLSSHLSQRGYEVFAMDVNTDAVLGLGAAKTYLDGGNHFERICAEIERPPFLENSFDVVICNASLHYSTSVDRTLEEVNRILRPAGVFVLMGSPVHRDPQSARRAQTDFRSRLHRLGDDGTIGSAYSHFTRADVEDVMRRRVGPVRELDFDPGFAFRWIRRAKGIVLRMELASFPLLSARKQGAGA